MNGSWSRRRSEREAASLEVRALYTIAELARVANVETYSLRRVLRASGVTFVVSGHRFLVPLSEIERKIPPLWESLRALERLRRGGSAAPSRPRRGAVH